MAENHWYRALGQDFKLVMMRALVFASVVMVSTTALIFGYWRFLDPVAPRMEVEHAEIRQIDMAAGLQSAARVFEVIRILTSDRDAAGTLRASFKIVPDDATTTFQGRPVQRDPTTFNMHPVPINVAKGRHLRDRLWVVPIIIVPGHYEYNASYEFCNPARCVRHHFDPMRIMLR